VIWTGEAVAAVLQTGRGGDRSFSEISTDTRTLQQDALFVALTGERFDGHAFLEAAREAGATGAVVRRGTAPPDGMEIFEVDDPLAAYGQLARARRRSVAGPVVAVTGTNGKTSTKEMLASILETRWRVHATPANFNNLIGVPRTILAAPADTEALVVEAGANTIGEIGLLRDIIEPTVAVITNVSAGHLAGFGSLDAVLTEKVSLVRDVPLAVVGPQPPALRAAAAALAGRVLTAGLNDSVDVAPDEYRIDDDGHATLLVRGQRVTLPLIGRHQAVNAMLALAVALELEVDPARAAAALQQLSLPGGRCEVVRHHDLVILNDTYNANPESMRASLETAVGICGSRPLVVAVGTMLELGTDSARLHGETAETIAQAEPKLVAATGEFIAAFAESSLPPDRLVASPDLEELGRTLRDRIDGNELVLVKASRGVRLERLIPFLTREDEV
jgi:UDP-N-acetylmuramoyl-tripeptide--D-alanyl-D-alanine ligase